MYSDKLIGLLHKCLETLDGTYGCTLDQNPNFKSYIEFLTQIGIRNPYWIEQKRFKLRILNGDEKRRLFSKMNLTILFPELPHGTITNKLWKDMHTIMESLRADTLSVDAIQFKTNNWLESFLLVNFTTEVTPYIHAFSSHVHQQIKHLKSKDLSLNDFSMQSLEKFNDFSTQYFQRSTNKRDDIEVQIAKKRNRVEVLKHHPFIVELIEDIINSVMMDTVEDVVENTAYALYEETILAVINQHFECEN